MGFKGKTVLLLTLKKALLLVVLTGKLLYLLPPLLLDSGEALFPFGADLVLECLPLSMMLRDFVLPPLLHPLAILLDLAL
jgi:hypothetical protein